MKMTAFWDIVPSSLVEVSEVRSASIIRERNGDYTALYPRRLSVIFKLEDVITNVLLQ
jgi:hypothetical protein